MAKAIWIPKISVEVVLKQRRYYRLFSVNFRQEKTAISQIFQGKDYNNHIPEERENGMRYEIQRVKYKPGTHIVEE